MNKLVSLPAIQFVLLIESLSVSGILFFELSKGFPFNYTSISAIGILLAATLALHTYIDSKNTETSKDYLNESLKLFQLSYEILSGRDSTGALQNDRLKWLTSSRLIIEAENISKKITQETQIEIFNESREYWRHKFHDLIFPSVEGFPESFYAAQPEHLTSHWTEPDRAPLSEKSLAILHRFIQWPKNKKDFSYDVDFFTDEEIENMEMFGPRGLGKLMKKVHDLRNEK